MKAYFDVWKTLHDEEFHKDKFLYHFTSVDSAIKILYHNSLKFSKISLSNDTLESKPKMCTSGKNAEYIIDVIRHFRDVNNNYLQLLCFTMDIQKNDKQVEGREVFTDYAGRGFALPRMWAQYAKNNMGICFIFNKNKLTKRIKADVGGSLIYHNPITYVSQFGQYEGDEAKSKVLLDQIIKYKSEMQRGIISLDFLKNNIAFVKYNYFSKLDDWRGENEYRFLAFGEDDFLISEIAEALVGVIVGENISQSDEYIIKTLCAGHCEIKKITFAYQGCKISTVN